MAESGAILYTAELALHERAHEITSHNNPQHIQLRSSHELWHKENLLNLAISRFPADWRYGAYVDADFLFTRPDWVYETIHQLQHHHWVQLFRTYSDLGPDWSVSPAFDTFAHGYRSSIAMSPSAYDQGKWWLGSPGGAWAFRREAFDAVGGLLETCILGAADVHMAYGLIQRPSEHVEEITCTPAYVKSLRDWA